MLEGTVKFFNVDKGFGFIEGSNGDVFVHASGVTGNPLQEGDKVTYEVSYDDRSGKERAENVMGGTGSEQKGFGKGKGSGKGKGKGFGKKGGYQDDSYGGGGYQQDNYY